MLTNFPTIRKAVKKMTTIDKMEKDGTFDSPFKTGKTSDRSSAGKTRQELRKHRRPDPSAGSSFRGGRDEGIYCSERS